MIFGSEGLTITNSVRYNLYIVRKIKRRKANWSAHILSGNCLLKHVIEGKTGGRTEVTGIRARRRKQLLDDLQEMRVYWNRTL